MTPRRIALAVGLLLAACVAAIAWAFHGEVLP